MTRTRPRKPTRYPGIAARTNADGTTSYVVDYRVNGRSRTRSFRRLSDAVAFKGTVTHHAALGTLLDPAAGRVTFDQYAERYADSRPWRPTTRAVHDAQIRRVKPLIGSRPLAQLRPTDIQGMVKRLTDEGLAPSTVAAILRRVRSVLAAAVDDRVIGYNPADPVKAPRLAGKTAEERAAALTPAQLTTLLDALPDRLRAFALTMALAGLRPGEAAGLTVDRVDFLRRTITVDRQLVTLAGHGTRLSPPKSAASVRVVPAADELVHTLAAHVDQHGIGPDGLLFRSRDNRPLRRGTMAQTWERAAEKISPAPPTSVRGWHALRHTFASAQLAAGTPLPVVSRLLGHASLAETMAVYSHALPDDTAAARNAAADVLLRPAQ